MASRPPWWNRGSAGDGRPPVIGEPRASEEGSVLTLGWVGLAVTGLALVLVVDLTAYAVAAGRAQAAADAAALAAVAAADPRAGSTTTVEPSVAAARAAEASGGELRRCDCRRGAGPVEVLVGVPVRAVAVTRFAGRTVTARARARLVREVNPRR